MVDFFFLEKGTLLLDALFVQHEIKSFKPSKVIYMDKEFLGVIVSLIARLNDAGCFWTSFARQPEQEPTTSFFLPST